MTTTDAVARDAVARDTGARRLRNIGYAALALLAYVPVLATKPGKVVADTKSYLYLDPGRLLARAASMWDPNIGMGTVTHQNIGYLFPMGPYYWLLHLAGVPAWVSQRLWFGSILFAAALGMLFLLRTLSVRGPGAPVAAVLFMLTPYTLDFAARISVILLPWAGLPWMLALTIRALRSPDRRGAWRYAALFAIVVQVVGGVNATALIFAGIAPVLWIVYAVLDGEVDWRRALRVTGQIAVLTVLTSLWWIAGLWAQSGYGLNILKFTETLRVVSLSSLPTEVLRGLGYWFFYGIDRVGHWTDASVPYTQNLGLLVVSFAIPALALLAAVSVRWRHRAYFIALTVVGVVVAVGANPYDDPSVVGGLFKSFAESSSFGLALRSTSRAVPLVALGLAVLIGSAVNAVGVAWNGKGRRVGGVSVRTLVLAGFVVGLAIANLPALWTGDWYTGDLTRDEAIPQYWTDAIAALDAQPHDTRILELPGADFAAYRWGQTVDPITPGLTDRPYVARELVPWGSAASADLLNALDQRLQEGTLDPSAIAPVARLMSVGSVVYRADLQTDRYDLVRAGPLWHLLTDPVPSGLRAPKRYGTNLGPPLRVTQDDEVQLARTGASDPPPVSVFAVDGVPAIVRSADASAPVIVSGDGEGLVDLATIGGLRGSGVVLYSATLTAEPARLRAEVAQPNSLLVVTDSNRKRARRWTSVRDVFGATERVVQSALAKDENDNRLDVFPGAGTDAQTVVQTPGVAVSTSRYGDPGYYQPEVRGARAFDGDTSTAWEVGAHANVIGEKLRLDLTRPITTGQVNLVQPLVGPNQRFLTQVKLVFDGGDPVVVNLDASSRNADGQTVTFPSRRFRRLDITIADTNVGDSSAQPFSNSVGFAEIRLLDDAPGANAVRADEIVRMPTDLVDRAGATVADRPLVYQMTRQRTVVIPPRYSSDEVALVRRFRVPDARTFGVRGTARLATNAPDQLLDTALGISDATAGGITVATSQHLPGDIQARGSSAFDGDPATAWSTAFGAPTGQWIDLTTAQPVTFDHLDLEVVADGKHSVPTQLQIEAGGETRTVDLPTIADTEIGAAPVRVPVRFDPLTGTDVRVTVTGVRPVTTLEYHEREPITMPVAIAEFGVPGVQRAAVPATLPANCRRDLLTVDGRPVGAQLAGLTAVAAAGRPVDLQLCPSTAAAGFTLGLDRGDHTVRSTLGVTTGIDVDGLVLGSDAGGHAMALGARGELPTTVTQVAARPAAKPRVTVTTKGSSKIDLSVSGARKGTPFWLVLGESNNSGWEATVDGKNVGGSTLVDGYANGWLVHPRSGTFAVTLRWTPQRNVWIALGISAVAFVVCLFLALRRRRAPVVVATRDEAPVLASPLIAPGARPRPIVVALGALGIAVAGALLAAWWVGVVAGALVALVLCVPRMRFLIALGAPLMLAVAAGYVVVQQYRYDYVADLDWPGRFEKINNIAWLAVILLLADVVVEFLRRRVAARDGP